MEKIRVLVVDDSAFMRTLISNMLSRDPNIEVVGTAQNGQVCLEKIPKLKPDVITLDIEMPVMDGLTTLEQILEKFPTPVVMVSSISDESTMKTLHAISKGAVDFIPKPSNSISMNLIVLQNEITEKVKTASKAKIKVDKKSKITIPPSAFPFNNKDTIICIGASTGGPRALEEVLQSLPAKISAPILIVQHMPAKFTNSLAKRLDRNNLIRVKEAEMNEIIKSGVAYVAPGDFHMRVIRQGNNLAISLMQDAARRGHRPSVDILLESLTSLSDYNKIVVILTGMGRDGSEGIVKLKEVDQSTFVISESEQTAIINGMPKAARKTGHVNMTLHLDQIGETLINLLNN